MNKHDAIDVIKDELEKCSRPTLNFGSLRPFKTPWSWRGYFGPKDKPTHYCDGGIPVEEIELAGEPALRRLVRLLCEDMRYNHVRFVIGQWPKDGG